MTVITRLGTTIHLIDDDDRDEADLYRHARSGSYAKVERFLASFGPVGTDVMAQSLGMTPAHVSNAACYLARNGRAVRKHEKIEGRRIIMWDAPR
jgi:hypothetical protein